MSVIKSVIKIENLTKRFGKFTALDGVNMLVKEGEVHAFLGPNGAGKTTTIRCILGILRATSGLVSIFGRDAFKDSVELHKQIAFVPGDVNLWPNMTGGEVIDLFTSFSGTKLDKNIRQKYLDMFEFDPTKKCRTYSKGNRQKVALISAFVSNASLFILDEPTSGLDPLLEKVFQECVKQLKAEGKSVLLSSHIMSEVEKLADSVSIIRKGKIVESGLMSQISQRADGKTLEQIFLEKYEDDR